MGAMDTPLSDAPRSKRPRRLCALQMHHTDARPALLQTSAVPGLRDSGLFDDVVLCVADVPENDVLEEYAQAWDVELVRGEERDVGARIRTLAAERGAETIARALVWWFFLDLELVERQLLLLEGGEADWVDLPRDFDQRFGVDAFRPRFLEKIEAAYQRQKPARERYGLNPWSYAERFPAGFEVETCTDVPTLDRAAFESIRATMRVLWPERWDGAGQPLFPYRLAREILRQQPHTPRSLDLASGLGAGTAVLGGVSSALGVDLDAEAVARCRERYGELAEFQVGEALSLDLPKEAFDVITSVHTLEHVDDDRAFLAAAERWLRPGGSLVLEVPFLAQGPFRGIQTPLSPDHVREYDSERLLSLVSERFEVQRAYGVARGAYVAPDRARSAGLVVARRAA